MALVFQVRIQAVVSGGRCFMFFMHRGNNYRNGYGLVVMGERAGTLVGDAFSNSQRRTSKSSLTVS